MATMAAMTMQKIWEIQKKNIYRGQATADKTDDARKKRSTKTTKGMTVDKK